MCVCVMDFCWSMVIVQCCASFSVRQSEPAMCIRSAVLSHGLLFAAPWTVARQTPLSLGFSRQE